jgi:hypothetical protein
MVWKNSSNEVLEIFCLTSKKGEERLRCMHLHDLQISSVESLCTHLAILNLNLITMKILC